MTLPAHHQDYAVWSSEVLPKEFHLSFDLACEELIPDLTEVIMLFNRDDSVVQESYPFPILRKSKSILQVPWANTLIVNYKFDKAGNWASVRNEGAYLDHYWVRNQSHPGSGSDQGPGLPLPEWKKLNKIDVYFHEKWLTLKWNGIPVLQGVPLPPRPYTGKWGFGSYWENTASVTISNIRWESIGEDRNSTP